jgi:hypothetical protein
MITRFTMGETGSLRLYNYDALVKHVSRITLMVIVMFPVRFVRVILCNICNLSG